MMGLGIPTESAFPSGLVATLSNYFVYRDSEVVSNPRGDEIFFIEVLVLRKESLAYVEIECKIGDGFFARVDQVAVDVVHPVGEAQFRWIHAPYDSHIVV